MSDERRRQKRFEAKVAYCRARADVLIVASGLEPARLARLTAALFNAVADAIRHGPAEERRWLGPLGDAMEDASESLRALGGLTDSRVRAALLRCVHLLSRVGARAEEPAEPDLEGIIGADTRRAALAGEADALRAALACAVSDTAWREHTRDTWITSGEDDTSQCLLPRAR